MACASERRLQSRRIGDPQWRPHALHAKVGLLGIGRLVGLLRANRNDLKTMMTVGAIRS